MTMPPRKRHVGAEQRRALLLLSSIPFGAAESSLLANGVTRRTLADLVRTGLATAERSGASIGAAGRVRITAAGRSLLSKID